MNDIWDFRATRIEIAWEIAKVASAERLGITRAKAQRLNAQGYDLD